MTTRNRSCHSSLRLVRWMVLLDGLLVWSGACTSHPLMQPVPDSVQETDVQLTIVPMRHLDLIFMVDNSPSMKPKQDKMKAQFPRLIEALRDPLDHTLPDLRIAVLDSDLGAGVSAQCSGPGTYGDRGHFQMRDQTAMYTGMSPGDIKATPAEIGGGFGGKTHVWTEPVALALSRKANRPVKLVMSREDVFRASGPASATSIDVKLGATRDGRIVAADATLRYTGGAFRGIWAELGAMTAWACYDIENVQSVGYDVIVNRPKVAAYRAPSAPMAGFAVESTVTLMADELGMDPVDFRLKNAAREGTRASYGPTYGPIGIVPTLEAVKKHPHMRARLGKNQGRGMACGFWFNFGGQQTLWTDGPNATPLTYTENSFNSDYAMGTGTDIAMESAGVTLVKGDLRGIVRARQLSSATMRNIKQNLFFAFVYNSLGVPIAAGVLYPAFGLLLSPMIAAAAMSFSSVSVIGNALRLSKVKM